MNTNVGKTYCVKFNFTKDCQSDLEVGVWEETVAKRVIKSELGLSPSVDNGDGDIRYVVSDADVFAKLLLIAFQSSDSAWIILPDGSVKGARLHIPPRSER